MLVRTFLVLATTLVDRLVVLIGIDQDEVLGNI
jgi:hypothetical protein